MATLYDGLIRPLAITNALLQISGEFSPAQLHISPRCGQKRGSRRLGRTSSEILLSFHQIETQAMFYGEEEALKYWGLLSIFIVSIAQ